MEVDEVSKEVVPHATAELTTLEEAGLPVPREHQNELVPLDSRVDTLEDDMKLDNNDTNILAISKSLSILRQTRSQTRRNEHFEPERNVTSGKQLLQIEGAH